MVGISSFKIEQLSREKEPHPKVNPKIPQHGSDRKCYKGVFIDGTLGLIPRTSVRN